MSEENEGPVRDRSGRIPLSLADELVGAWTLASYTVTDEAGVLTHVMGEDATGLMVCTPDGYVAVQVMAAAGGGHGDDPERDAQDAAGPGRYVAYAGPATVDEHGGRLTHLRSVALDPAERGHAQEYDIELHGDALTVTADPMDGDGGARVRRLVWHRATAPDEPREPGEPTD